MPLATAPRADSTHWEQSQISWDELVAWCESPGDRKECGAYIPAVLADGRRTRASVLERHAITLDADRSTQPSVHAAAEQVESLLGCRALVHTTWRSEPGQLRLRYVIPTSRPLSGEEYTHVADRVMALLGVDQFDPCGRKPEQLMFKPSSQGYFDYAALEGPLLDVDRALAVDPKRAAAEAILERYAGHVRDGLRPDGTPAAGRNESVAFHLPLLQGFVLSGALDESDLERLWEAVPGGDHDYTRAEFEASMRSAKEAAFAQVPHAAAEGDEGGKAPGLAQQVAAHAFANYAPHCSPDGEPFAVPVHGAPLAIPLGKRGGGLIPRIILDFHDRGRLLAEDTVVRGLGPFIASARMSETATPLHLRVAHDEGRIVLDLGQRGSTRCAVVTADGWTVEDQPPEGVFFRRPASLQPLPEPSRGGSGLGALRDLLGLQGDAWGLVAGWLVASLRADTARPLLLFAGPPGSAKSTRGLMTVNVLDPRDQLGSSLGKRLDDERVRAASRYLLGFDNLGAVSAEVSDHICRLVTGENAEKRALYTDGDLVALSYKRTGVLTAVNLPAQLASDALERIIMINCEAISENERLPEAELQAAFAQAHPSILAGVLDGAVTMLQNLPGVLLVGRPGPRMLDFAQSLEAFDPAAREVYAANRADLLGSSVEQDPVLSILLGWLARQGGSAAGPPQQIYAELTYAAQAHRGLGGGYWPANARAMGALLNRSTVALAAAGVSFSITRSAKSRTWHLETMEIDHEE